MTRNSTSAIFWPWHVWLGSEKLGTRPWKRQFYWGTWVFKPSTLDIPMNVRDSPSKNWGFSITAFLLTSRGYSNASSWLRLLANLCQSCWLVHVFDGDASETSPFWVVAVSALLGCPGSWESGLIPEDDVTRHSISPLFIRGLATTAKRRRSDSFSRSAGDLKMWCKIVMAAYLLYLKLTINID